MPSLNERFENLLEVTLRRHRRDYGVLGGLAHLVLTNRLKLPMPTLMREAKELSVVIERNLPSGNLTNLINLLELFCIYVVHLCESRECDLTYSCTPTR